MNANNRRLLAAISPSSRSVETLITALALARKSGADLMLLQAVELNIPGEERGIPRGSLLRDLMTAAESRLMAWARAICGEAPFSVVVSEGPPSAAILDAAQRFGASAIVLGPRQSGFQGWFRRNNARSVLQNAGCPVYLVAPQNRFPAFPARELPANEVSPIYRCPVGAD